MGLDGRALQGSRTGVGRYVFELCKELDRQLPSATFFVYSNVPVELPISSARWVLRVDPSKWASKMKSVLWLKLRCGALCERDNLDVFWGSAVFLPVLPEKVRTAITVYDLTYKIVPRTMGVTHRWAFRLFFKNDLLRSDSVLAISKGTSDRLFKLYGRAADAIVYPAVNNCFKRQSEEFVQQILSQYSLTNPYLLAVATLEPRKNLELLIRTFLDMKRRGLLCEHKLVLVGGRGWKDRRLVELIAGASSVIPLGYISDASLAPLYSGAEAFIFPSLYEGFGIPILEAIACETKVVTSDIPELREAGRGDAIYIDPTAAGIEEGVLQVLTQSARKNGVDISRQPSWKQEAKKLTSALLGQSAIE